MEKASTPNVISSTLNPPQSKDKAKTNTTTPQKKKLPTPQEMISHYEAQGIETREASIKVIEDLQNILFRVVTSGKGKKDRFMAETSKKLDSSQNRLKIVELKVDSKPGYAETLAIGVASGAVLKGIGSAFPHVINAFGQMWNAVRSTTKSSS